MMAYPFEWMVTQLEIPGVCGSGCSMFSDDGTFASTAAAAAAGMFIT